MPISKLCFVNGNIHVIFYHLNLSWATRTFTGFSLGWGAYESSLLIIVTAPNKINTLFLAMCFVLNCIFGKTKRQSGGEVPEHKV